MNKRANPISTFYYLINSLVMIICMDKIEKYIRLNMGFELIKGEFERVEKEYLDSFKNNGIIKNIIMYFRYRKKFRNIDINKPNKPRRVRIVGELFSLIDSNTSFDIERKLIKMGVEIYRDTDLTYLLITKRFILNRMIKKGKKYLKYHLGADGTASIVRSINSNYMDGILHLKSFGCTPEISAMSILPKIANEYKIPILYFSFDSEDNEVGVDTRLEAFYDMIKRRNNG